MTGKIAVRCNATALIVDAASDHCRTSDRATEGRTSVYGCTSITNLPSVSASPNDDPPKVDRGHHDAGDYAGEPSTAITQKPVDCAQTAVVQAVAARE